MIEKTTSFYHFIERSYEIVANFIDSGYKPIVLFSGGRDSLVTLHVVRSLAEKVTAIHVDTTVSTPGNLEYVKRICDELDVELVILRPKTDI